MTTPTDLTARRGEVRAGLRRDLLETAAALRRLGIDPHTVTPDDFVFDWEMLAGNRLLHEHAMRIVWTVMAHITRCPAEPGVHLAHPGLVAWGWDPSMRCNVDGRHEPILLTLVEAEAERLAR